MAGLRVLLLGEYPASCGEWPELIFFLAFDGFITMPPLLLFGLSLDKFEEFLAIPEEIRISEAMDSMVFEFDKAVHIELHVREGTCRMKDW